LFNITKKIALQALDCSSEALVIVSTQKPDLPIVYVNTAFEMLTGHDAEAVIGESFGTLVLDLDVDEAGRPAEDEVEFEQRWHSRAGAELELSVRRAPLFDRPGAPSYWLFTARRPSGAAAPADEVALRDALQDARRKLKQLERVDSATGLPNDSAFAEVLQRDWGVARREQRCISLVVFEVDRLEEYRRSLGRHATDSVLRKIGHAMSGSLRRATDFGARVGDARFAALLSAADEAQAGAFAERAVRKVNDLAIPHPRSPLARIITVSYGISCEIPDVTATSHALREQAEERLATAQAARDAAEQAAEQGGTTRSDLKKLSR
jgi:diguanylate cyclase (GGDEF)-like protein/PAS domain S-box-containing protein